MESLHPGHIIEDGIEKKKCSHEKRYQPLTEFSRRSCSKDGLSYNCKKCDSKIASESYIRRQKMRNAQQVATAQTYKENQEKRLAWSRANYIRNREARLEQSRLYRQAHPEVDRAAAARRRTALRSAPKDRVTRKQIIERDSILINGTLTPICQICMLPVEHLQDLDIDHIVPVKQGGSDMADNKRVAHRKCNGSRPKDGRDLLQVKLAHKLKEEDFTVEEVASYMSIEKKQAEKLLEAPPEES